MRFYIVTPAYNSLSWLQRCVRSVADQVMEGVEIHHHVQDGGSTDGTGEWLQKWLDEHADVAGYAFTYESARDKGMYDALNIAWSKMPETTDVTAHLNSDEQYLPRALRGVAEFFKKRPEADVLATSYIIHDAAGRYICHRRSVRPHKLRCDVMCEMNTCTCFHRAEPFCRHGIRFDTRYRSIADMVMYRDMMRYGVRVHACPELMTSSFAITGSNLAWSDITASEHAMADEDASRFLLRFRRELIILSNILRRLNDWKCKTPREYDIYLGTDMERTHKLIKHPTAKWAGRMAAEDEE